MHLALILFSKLMQKIFKSCHSSAYNPPVALLSAPNEPHNDRPGPQNQPRPSPAVDCLAASLPLCAPVKMASWLLLQQARTLPPGMEDHPTFTRLPTKAGIFVLTTDACQASTSTWHSVGLQHTLTELKKMEDAE